MRPKTAQTRLAILRRTHGPMESKLRRQAGGREISRAGCEKG